MASGNSSFGALWHLLLQKRLERMSYKEAKLDVTVLVNYCLARWWVKFAVHGPQLSVGFTASKLMDLVQLTASLSGLSIAWVAYGVLTGQFERDERTREQSLQKWVATSATTCGQVVPIAVLVLRYRFDRHIKNK